MTSHSVINGRWFKSMLRNFVPELLGRKYFKTPFSNFLYLTGHYWVEQTSVWAEVTAVYLRSRFFVFTWVQHEASLFFCICNEYR